MITPDLITIVVPTRNEAKNLPSFLNSLPPEAALIVVNHSTDATRTVCETVRPRNSSVIDQPLNVTAARQRGGEAASTPWLLFTDADVIFAPDYFARLAALPEKDAFYGPKLSQDRHRGYYRWFARGQQAAHRLGMPAVSGSNLVVRRTTFERIGGFDLRLTCNEDSEIGWRIKRAGFQIDFVSNLIVYARDHRRLDRSRGRKTLHTLLRCSMLYFNLMPSRWRSSDWGYWKDSSPILQADTDS
jgi:glycosyltransferase involved in cell wall biosynthesis